MPEHQPTKSTHPSTPQTADIPSTGPSATAIAMTTASKSTPYSSLSTKALHPFHYEFNPLPAPPFPFLSQNGLSRLTPSIVQLQLVHLLPALLLPRQLRVRHQRPHGHLHMMSPHVCVGLSTCNAILDPRGGGVEHVCRETGEPERRARGV